MGRVSGARIVIEMVRRIHFIFIFSFTIILMQSVSDVISFYIPSKYFIRFDFS